MERYNVIKEVGNGTFGSVWRALNKQTGEVVAIKQMKKKYYSWEECINLREVKSLRKMNNHPNIVKLKEVIREHDILYFVFEYMECNLYQLMRNRGKLFPETEVKSWCFQVFQGLTYMHQRGFFHRDLKPENLLVSKDIIKIADFGLAREIDAQPPYTEYVSTRWYRAPEVLLQSPIYGPAVDMWAMGAIISELLTLRPLFPGSSEADQIYKICNVIGSPTECVWAKGLELAGGIGYQFPQVAGVHLSALMPSASDDAINLITSLCSWDPTKRPTASEALQHPFFQCCFYVPPSLRPKLSVAKTPPPVGTKTLSVEQKSGRRYSGMLPDVKPTSNSPKPHMSIHAGVQRKLEMNSLDDQKYQKNTIKQQPRYRPPVKNAPIASNGGRIHATAVSDTAEKLGRMSIGSRKQLPSKHQPPPMKAGGWHGQSDLFLGRSQEHLPGRTFTRIRNVESSTRTVVEQAPLRTLCPITQPTKPTQPTPSHLNRSRCLCITKVPKTRSEPYSAATLPPLLIQRRRLSPPSPPLPPFLTAESPPPMLAEVPFRPPQQVRRSLVVFKRKFEDGGVFSPPHPQHLIKRRRTGNESNEAEADNQPRPSPSF